MHIASQSGLAAGIEVHEFDPAMATHEDIRQIRQHIYTDKIVVFKGQKAQARAFVELGRLSARRWPITNRCTTPESGADLRIIKSHPRRRAGRRPEDGRVLALRLPVHAGALRRDHVLPQQLPISTRGTRFHQYGHRLSRPSPRLKEVIAGTRCRHSVRRYARSVRQTYRSSRRGSRRHRTRHSTAVLAHGADPPDHR